MANQINRPDHRDPVAHWTFDEYSGVHATDQASGISDEIHYALRQGRFGSATEPQRRPGVSGGALLFDGYSTWIERDAEAAPAIGGALTLLAWVAPRSFERGEEGRLSAIVNRHNREAAEGYALGLYRHGSWSLQLGIGGEWHELWCRDQPLPKGKWSFVAATFDRASSTMRLYLDGEKVAERRTPADMPVSECRASLAVGKNNQATVLAEAFRHNMFDGLMDDVRIYDRALDADELHRLYDEALQPYGGIAPAIPFADIRLDRTPLLSDRHRPQYHASPPVHWMNEPHAPIYYEGRYHLFYQHNPQGPYWAQIHWGHWVSEDMVHWRDLPVALAPELGAVDPDGVWSGSAAYDEHGVPALFFTAGDDSASPNQRVGLARSSFQIDGDLDLTNWVKHPEPLIVQEQGQGKFGDFRDPFVWKEDDTWYLLIGSGTDGEGGSVLGYTSGDMIHWTYRGPLYVSDAAKYPQLGNMWELPVLLPFGQGADGRDKHVFLISPLGPGADVEVIYWIGEFDRDEMRFVPDNEEPQLIDVGDFHFTGPSGMVDPKTGRNIVFTIAQGERTPQIDYDSGWAHNAGLPVSIYLRPDGQLGVEPIRELESLRDLKLCSVRNISLEDANRALEAVRGDMLEIRIVFESEEPGGRLGLWVRQSPDRAEETLLYYDRGKAELGVDRNKTTLSREERSRGIQSGTLDLAGEPLSLAVYLDRSMIEAYANGLKSLTTRAYPSRLDAIGLQLLGSGKTRIRSLEVWTMKSIYG